MKDSIERVLQWLSSSEEDQESALLHRHHHVQTDNSAESQPVVDSEIKRLGGILPCKACNERNASCDGQRPRCSHCLHEQLMCFYIGSGRARVRRQ